MKDSEERLKILFDYAPDAYYIHDLKGNFIDANKQAEKLIGYKKEELIGKDFFKLKLLSTKDMPKAANFSYPVANIILQHHERLNGSGYPQGIKSEEILLEAKIIGVADVVKAMSSHRPYRPALGINAALEEIVQNKDILYDPETVDVCLKLFKEKGFKFNF